MEQVPELEIGVDKEVVMCTVTSFSSGLRVELVTVMAATSREAMAGELLYLSLVAT
jgi:hypothetical protein